MTDTDWLDDVEKRCEAEMQMPRKIARAQADLIKAITEIRRLRKENEALLGRIKCLEPPRPVEKAMNSADGSE